MEVICQYCKSQTRKVEKKDAARFEEKNFHKECVQLYIDRKELYSNICRIFKLKKPGQKNNAYVAKFFNQDMTYKGMTKTLIYFYDIKGNSTDKSNGGVGIIPYIYEEARDYYLEQEKIRKKQEELLNNAEKGEQSVPKTRLVRVQKIERKPLITPLPLVNYFEE